MSGNGDYISREAALAFQNEVDLLLCRNVVTHDIMSATKDADMVKYLLSIPAADVRTVVLCRDCKHRGNTMDCPFCWLADKKMGDEHFCSFGEKREES